MKRIFSLLLVLCLLIGLVGCGKNKDDKQAGADTVTTDTNNNNNNNDNNDDPVGGNDQEDPGPDDVAYRHPLTGAPLENPWAGRPVAVVIPNNKGVYPHHGTSHADIFYEIEAEGSVTRCLAIISDLTGIEKLGPVRSARTYFNNVAYSYNAPITHCGGSPGGISGRYDSAGGATIPNWPHIDEMQMGNFFYRDTERYNSGYLWEYTLFTTGDLLKSAMEARKYTAEVGNYDLTFGDKPSTETGESAQQIVVKFRGGKKTIVNYADGCYDMIQHGDFYKDGNTGEKVTFRNVLMLQAEQWYENNRTYYDLIGTGTGYYACDGKIIPIKWERPTLEDSFSYYLEDGTKVTLGVGTSYIAVFGQKGSVSYQ